MHDHEGVISAEAGIHRLLLSLETPRLCHERHWVPASRERRDLEIRRHDTGHGIRPYDPGVIPAKAGIQCLLTRATTPAVIPAKAGIQRLFTHAYFLPLTDFRRCATSDVRPTP